jgi:predicted nucleic acid-binding protein
MDFMIDAQVLIFACINPNELPDITKENPKLALWMAESKALVEGHGVRICAVAWTESIRALNDDEARELAKFRNNIRIESLEPDAAERAAELLREHKALKDICPKCHNANSDNACEVCGTKLHKSSRLADALILAQAAVDPTVKVLYSCDRGVHKLAPLAKVRVEYPTVGPLFAKMVDEPSSGA